MGQVATSSTSSLHGTDAGIPSAAWCVQPSGAPTLCSAPQAGPGIGSATVNAALSPILGGDGVAEAASFTRQLTHSHYENFSVISLLLPRYLRQDFCNIYAFCRVADDIADELGDRAEATHLLGCLRDQTRACYDGKVSTVLFAAVSATIRRHNIPPKPFLDLIDAFEQDQRVNRYATLSEVVDYCRRSADPVGRLVLYLCGYRDAERQELSDRTCTALQLANFWQDVRRDLLDRDRIYLPQESMNRFGVTEAQIREGRCNDAFKAMLRSEVQHTQTLFDEGAALLPLLRPAVRRQVALFGLGGQAVLDAIRRQDYDTLTSRPTLSRWQKAKLVVRALVGGSPAGSPDAASSREASV